MNRTRFAPLFEEPQLSSNSEPIGDPLPCLETNSSTLTSRIVFGNLKGCQLDTHWSHFQTALKGLQKIRCDLVGLSEINVDTRQPAVVARLRDDLHGDCKHAKMSMASTPLPARTSTYKPGGTMSLALGNIAGRVVKSSSDDLGRWTSQTLSGKGGRLITVVSVYQPCQRYSNKSSFRFWDQQVTCLSTQGRSDLDPRRQFTADLKNYLLELADQKHLLIVGGDFNQTFADGGALSTLCSEPTLDLLDTIAFYHPDAQDQSTYELGSRRLDYILMSTDIVHTVTACGYLPMNKVFQSDHRLAFMDIDTDALFGDPSKLAPPSMRDIKANRPKLVTKYLECYRKYLLDHNFEARFAAFTELEQPNHRLAEKIDRILTDGATYAGKQCRLTQRNWYSTKLAFAEAKVELLVHARRACRRGRALPTDDHLRETLPDFRCEVPSTLEEISAALTQAKVDRKAARLNDRYNRDSELAANAKQAMADNNKALAKVYWDMLYQEKANRVWDRIGRMNSKGRSQGITKVEVPVSWPQPDTENADPKTTDEAWTTIEIPTEVERFIQERNQRHFGQAQGTPFTVAPLSTKFDWAASTVSAETVLEGSYSDADLSDIQSRFLQHCRYQLPAATRTAAPALVTVDQYIRRIRRWRESTTTSPSGLHLGHAKALVNHFHSNVDKDPEHHYDLLDTRQMVLEARVALLNYATTHRYSFDRWKTIVNVMIEKDPGDHRIHRLRVIHIYEHDLSIYLALHWKRMMYDAERRGLIHNGQYGGRKGRDPQTLVLYEELKNEICHFSRKNMVNFDNDAASCYDRILPSLASLIGRSKGLHKSVIFVHATTLKEAKFKLKTALGISEKDYSHSDLKPIYGTGQGSTNSPMIWTLVSSVLFDVHTELAYGAEFVSPDGKIRIRTTIVGFVDDANGTVTDFLNDDQSDVATLVLRAQHDAQLWSDLLWMSGGLLELPKCSYHLLYYKFNSEGRPYPHQDLDHPITLQHAHGGPPVNISQMRNQCAHKTLGHYKAPDDKGSAQFAQLSGAVNTMTRRIQGYPLRRTDARIYYNQVLAPKFQYFLPQCYFSEAKLERPCNKLHHACASACGFASSMPKEIRYGPYALGGAGFIPLYVRQGSGQIINLLKLLRSKTMLQPIWQCALSWAQLSAGVDYDLLQHPSRSVPYLEGHYIQSLRTFLASINGSVILQESLVPIKQRVNDLHIMSFAICHGRSPKDLRLINYCRLYYQAVTLSDIADLDGRGISKSYNDFSLDFPRGHTKWHHVYQPIPPRKLLRYVWRTLLKDLSKYLKRHPLGPWTVPPSQQRFYWSAYYDHVHDHVYLTKHKTYYIRFDRDPRYGDRYYSRTDCFATTLPYSCCPMDAPVTVSTRPWTAYRFRVHSYPPVPTYIRCPIVDPQYFISFLDELGPHFSNLFDDYSLKDAAARSFFQYLHNRGASESTTLLFVSDGSSPPYEMSFGWTCRDDKGRCLTTVAGPAFGSYSSSHRAEGYGLLSAIIFAYYSIIFFGLDPNWTYQFWSDNKPLIDACRGNPDATWPDPNSTLTTDWDLVSAILHFYRLLPPSTVSFHHVYGHQDDHETYADLSLESQMNVDADAAATKYRVECPCKPSFDPTPFPGNPVQLVLHDEVITSKHSKCITYAATAPALKRKLCEQFKWTDITFQSIDWGTHRQLLANNQLRDVQMVKLCNEYLPTAHRLAKWTNGPSTCPRCHSSVETVAHIIRCGHSEEWFLRTLRRLTTACTSLSTNVDYVLEALVKGLRFYYYKGRVQPLDFEHPPQVYPWIRAQSVIGWDQLFRGRLSIEWRHALQLPRPGYDRGKADIHHSDPWCYTVASTLVDCFFELWELRNNAAHAGDVRRALNVYRHRQRSELIYLHSKFPETLFLDRNHIKFLTEDPLDYETIDAFLDANSKTTIDHWITLNGPLILASAKKSKSAPSGTPSISKVFPQLPPSTRQRHRRSRARAELLNPHATKNQPPRRPKHVQPALTSLGITIDASNPASGVPPPRASPPSAYRRLTRQRQQKPQRSTVPLPRITSHFPYLSKTATNPDIAPTESVAPTECSDPSIDGLLATIATDDDTSASESESAAGSLILLTDTTDDDGSLIELNDTTDDDSSDSSAA
mmetsp:Transcript_30358/g.72755  ORF Transcript_30358/g.72755 Transcript_30358/m.72755 type:complete len:2117 (+) Transcript_30358:2729-9079(+)